jgi:hypothetical protein
VNQSKRLRAVSGVSGERNRERKEKRVILMFDYFLVSEQCSLLLVSTVYSLKLFCYNSKTVVSDFYTLSPNCLIKIDIKLFW